MSQGSSNIPITRAEEAPLAVAVEVRFGFMGWLAARGRKSVSKHVLELAGKLIEELLNSAGEAH